VEAANDTTAKQNKLNNADALKPKKPKSLNAEPDHL
jgi:hypothetical protein